MEKKLLSKKEVIVLTMEKLGVSEQQASQLIHDATLSGELPCMVSLDDGAVVRGTHELLTEVYRERGPKTMAGWPTIQ